MKIWVIGRDYPLKYNNMCGSFELEQAQMLTKYHEVCYPAVDFHTIKRWRKWGLERITDAGVHVYKMNLPFGKLPEKAYVSIRKRLFLFLFKKMKEEYGQPDIIHVHYPALFDPAWISEYLKAGTKIVCTEHWTKVQQKEIDFLCTERLKWYVDNADSFITVGEKLKDSILELTKSNRRIDIIPNIINDCFFRAKDGTGGQRDFTFVTVGRLVPVKQFDKVIEAFADVFREVEHVRLNIVGDGEKLRDLKSLVRKLDIESKVFFLGNMDRQNVARQIKNSDVLICYSRLETFGVPVIEGMACGKPFIGTESLGFLEYLPLNCGQIVNSSDQEEIEDALLNIYRHYEDYDSEYITGAARELFSEEIVRKKLNEIYCRIKEMPEWV